jgi:hypothetical protein
LFDPKTLVGYIVDGRYRLASLCGTGSLPSVAFPSGRANREGIYGPTAKWRDGTGPVVGLTP